MAPYPDAVLLATAQMIHDREVGVNHCDPKYLSSCSVFSNAILQAPEALDGADVTVADVPEETTACIVALKDSQRAYGPFYNKRQAERFADFLKMAVDPAVVLPLFDPIEEMLAYASQDHSRNDKVTPEDLLKDLRRMHQLALANDKAWDKIEAVLGIDTDSRDELAHAVIERLTQLANAIKTLSVKPSVSVQWAQPKATDVTTTAVPLLSEGRNRP